MVVACCDQCPYTPSSRVEMNSLDLAPLQGRKIVVDPGHGGRFVGAVGSRGLRESDINLAVGLHLWGLLNQAGAQAWLTRSADVDLCPHEEANLGEDLDARSHLGNNLKADLFISIHHNSDIRDRRKNNIQVYYKLTDSGPSRDLAQSVAQALRKGSSINDVFVFPGNYRVLRNTDAAAILGEASFITNRKNEKRLSRSNQLRREAEDYFLGILTYCQRGIPQVIDHSPAQTTIGTARPQINAKIIGGSGDESIDPEDTTLFLDDVLVPSSFNPHTGMITYVPDEPLNNGKHTYYIGAHNLNGNSSRKRPVHFSVSLPPSSVDISSSFSSLPADGVSSSRLEIVSRDTHGNPVIDGTLIALSATAGRLEKEIVSTANGRGIGYFFSPKEIKDVMIEARCQNIIAEATISCGPVDDALVRLAITNHENKPLDNVRVKDGAEILEISDRNGLAFISSPGAKEPSLTLERPGYASKKERVVFEKGGFRQERFALLPWEEGLVLGKIITLDPEPWDDDTEREFGLRADGEKANLFVVNKLQGLLEKAGARVAVTWDGLSQRPTPGERVLVGEDSSGDYFITLTHRKGKPYVAHYFRSQTGKQLAQALAQSLKKELPPLKKIAARDAADFTIIHPRCPSIVINFGKKQVPKKRERRQDVLAKEAQGVYEGLLGFLKEEKEREQ
jgi:N-acetylmuramoyl-L-alanine amidase